MQSDTYANGYFNIQDIMASHERVSCKFEIDVANMGKIHLNLIGIHLKLYLFFLFLKVFLTQVQMMQI